MNRTFKAAVATLMLAVGFAGPAATGQFEDAAVAYKKGDHATALRLMRPLAEEGNAAAQFDLGVMYQFSRDVPQDYGAAANWYRKAAEQGLAEAQYNLGVHVRQRRGRPAGLRGRAHVVQLGCGQRKQKRGESSEYCRRGVDARAGRGSADAGPRVEADIASRTALEGPLAKRLFLTRR
jgi:TPR repeat protein